MLDPNWVFLSAALGVLGSIRYAVATLQGRARPNLVSWSLWAMAPLIAFFAQLDAGVGRPAALTLASGVGPLVVVVSAVLSSHGRARLGPFDGACGVLALAALGVWVGLGEAPLAVLVAVAADAIAAVPTVIKAWREPASENVGFYALVGTGAAITLLTIRSAEPASWAFAAYVLVLCLVLVGVLVVRRRRGRPHSASERGTGRRDRRPTP